MNLPSSVASSSVISVGVLTRHWKIPMPHNDETASHPLIARREMSPEDNTDIN